MDLNQVTSEKDLGITVQDDLQFTKHLADKVKKANSMLGLINRSFQHIENKMLIHLYKALVRPHVEYAPSVWLPLKHCDIKLIEGVQRRATRLSRDLWNEPYNIRLTTLCLPTLPFRRERDDMSQIFKNPERIRGHRILRLQTTQPTSGGAVTVVSSCCANCVEPPRPQQWGSDLPFFGHAGHADPLDGWRCCSQKRVMSKPIQV